MPRELFTYALISAPMPFQMALDEILFERLIETAQAQAVLRFYYASEPWISIGYSHAGWKSQPTSAHSQGLLRDGRNRPVCRRITGGGRVVHGEDIMFTLMAPKDAEPSFSSVMGSYTRIHEILLDSLGACGIQAGFYREDADLPQGKDCFLFPIASDLEFRGKKIAGGGQKRSRGYLLHQESVCLDRQDLYEGLRSDFSARFAAALGRDLKDCDWDPLMFEEAERLGNSKYAAACGSGVEAV
ncbi:MAG: hypothetical protein FGM27_07965 [Candidatus Omnitrophica bacterium]|nr:hypothetical protein [Candidatus Omnitrophota bacterium]